MYNSPLMTTQDPFKLLLLYRVPLKGYACATHGFMRIEFPCRSEVTLKKFGSLYVHLQALAWERRAVNSSPLKRRKLDLSGLRFPIWRLETGAKSHLDEARI